MSSDECGNCHAELDNGRHICMSNFTVPSLVPITMSIIRDGDCIDSIELLPGDEIEFNVIDEDVMFASDEDEDEANK